MPMPQTDADIRKTLETLKNNLERLCSDTAENRRPVALDQQSVGRLSRMDSLQVQAMDKAQQQARRKQIIRIDAALARLELGDYGYCVTCDDPISKKRLDLDPATPLCITCAK